MAAFKIDQFRGIRPRVAPRLLAPGEAQISRNTRLGSGDLEPWPNDRFIKVMGRTHPRSIFYYNNAGDPIWLEWEKYDVSVAESPTEGDLEERLYFTGAPDNPLSLAGPAKPKMTYAPFAKTGTTDTVYPKGWRYLGVPPPATAIAATNATPTDSIQGTSSNVRMKEVRLNVTYVDPTYPGTCTLSQWAEHAAGSLDYNWRIGVGDRYYVTEVVDSNTVKLANRNGSGYLFQSSSTNGRFDRENTGACVQRKYQIKNIFVLDNTEFILNSHNLRQGDVIEVTSVPEQQHTYFSSGIKFYDSTAEPWGTPETTEVSGTTYYGHAYRKAWFNAVGSTVMSNPLVFSWKAIREDSALATLESRVYAYTYVSSLGEESSPSPPSVMVDAYDGDTITLSSFAAPPAPYNTYLSWINIYRTATGSDGTTEYFFVKQVAYATAIGGPVIDDVPTAELGEQLATTNWSCPPENLQGIVTLATGSCVGFAGRQLVFSEPYQPHAWPYIKYVDADIVALAPLGDSLLVLTNSYPYILTGSHPRTMGVRRVELEQPCVSVTSVAVARDTVYYASPDGLVAISPAGYSVISEPYISKREWQDLGPETMIGMIRDQVYYGFYETLRITVDDYRKARYLPDGSYRIVTGGDYSICLVFDPVAKDVGMSKLALHPVAVHYAPQPDQAYYVRDDVPWLMELFGSEVADDNRTFTWRSGVIKSPYPMNPSAARVDADSYPVTFELIANGKSRAVVTVQDEEAFRLPAGYMASDFEVELTGTSRVRSVQFGETLAEVASG